MECIKNPVNNGIFIIYQLVIAGFMNHQSTRTHLSSPQNLGLSTNFRKAPGTRCCPWLWLRLPWLYPPWAPPGMEKSSGEAMRRAVVVMVVRWQANTEGIHWWFTYQLLHGLAIIWCSKKKCIYIYMQLSPWRLVQDSKHESLDSCCYTPCHTQFSASAKTKRIWGTVALPVLFSLNRSEKLKRSVNSSTARSTSKCLKKCLTYWNPKSVAKH